MRYPSGTKIWIIHAPPGVVTSGPMVITNWPDDDAWAEEILSAYRGRGWEITSAIATDDEEDRETTPYT